MYYGQTVKKIQSMMNSIPGKAFSEYHGDKACYYFFYKLMESSYLVDPASSHMLVSKIKPCMSKYKQICTVKLRMAH